MAKLCFIEGLSMLKTIPLAVVIAMLLGCGGNDDNITSEKPGSGAVSVKVFKSDGSKQCQMNGVALDVMKGELIKAGIDVICAQQGSTGLLYPQVCDTETGVINIYHINAQNLQDAEKLGFKSISELPAYQDTRCNP